MFKRAVTVGALLLLQAAVLCRAQDATNECDVVRALLRERAFAFDVSRADSAALAALLHAVDPRARLLTADEAHRLEQAQAGLAEGGACATGAVSAATNPVPLSVLADLERWPEELAYLQVRSLCPGGGAELAIHLQALAANGLHGLILDLRNAEGTDLASVAAAAGPVRCPGRPLFSVQDRQGQTLESSRAAEAQPLDAVVMVLIDRTTRDAAELLAGVLKGAPGVMLIGDRTAGDALVRELIALPDGRRLLVGTRQAVLADGSSYAGTGIVPDIAVEPWAPPRESDLSGQPAANNRAASAKTLRDLDLARRVADDPPLRRATDLLLGLKALGMYDGR